MRTPFVIIIKDIFLVYFMIVYKPFSLLYKLSGALMTGLILAGYGICIANIIFTSKSKCKDSTLGKLSLANAVIFLVIASIVLVFVHVIIWVPICCGNKANGMDKVQPNADESQLALK
jgi:hypothetical protein